MAFNYRSAPRDFYQHDNRRGSSSRGQSRPRYQNNRKAAGGRGYMKGNVRVDGDGDICMGGDEEPRDGGRFAPYAKPGYSQARGGLRRGRGRGGGNGDYETDLRAGNTASVHRDPRFPDERSWNKILIPYGRRYEKNFILKSLTQSCPIPFIPVNYHTDGNSAIFYLEDHEAAAALRQLNQKIMTPVGQKMSIVVRPSSAPLGTIPRESVEHVKSCISRRYNPVSGVLDLSYFHQDMALKAGGHFLPLYRQAVAFSAVETIEENVRDLVVLNLTGNKLKSLEVFGALINKQRELKKLFLSENSLKMYELERLKGLPIEEISLKKNPVLSDFNNQSDLIE